MLDSGTKQFEKGKFLTETQRAYLNGDYEPPSQNAEKQNRYKIRQRTLGALYDLSTVASGLSNEDIELIFDPLDPSEEMDVYDFEQVLQLTSFHNRLTNILTMLILGIESAESLYVSTPIERETTDGYVHDFESIPDKEVRKEIVKQYGEEVLTDFFMTPDIHFDVEAILRKAIEHSARRRNERVVSVTVETEPISEDIDQLRKRFEEEKRLTREQLQLLNKETEISGQDIQKYWRNRQADY